MDVIPQISQEQRRLTFNYDIFEKDRTQICFSPPISGKKPRDLSVPRGTSRHFYTETTNSHVTLLTSIEPELLSKAKHLVNDAIMKKKIFTIIGPYDKIRQTLKARGWVEKLTDEKSIVALYSKLNKMTAEQNNKNNENPKNNVKEYLETITKKNEDRDYLDYVASLLVLNCTPDLIWSLRLAQIDERSLKSGQIINHFKKAGSFTTKIGLIKSFYNLGWFDKNDDEVFPRSYILSDDNEKKAFLDDYYLTACMGLIKLTAEITDSPTQKQEHEGGDNVVSTLDKNNSTNQLNKVKPLINYKTKEVGESEFKVDHRYPEMAIHFCEFYLKNYKNKDLDQRQVVFCSPKRWEEFFENYYNVTNEGYGIQSTPYIRERCLHICNELQKIHPQFNLDGTKNIWIVKPGAKSRGRGIFCASKFTEINDVVRTTSETLIVQKYIENPLLVYKTKFDIRQWFLVTSWSPLTIWWYKDSYIRFCSQQFTLSDFNESVHLSNNSIQFKYQNGTRSEYLPSHNMWEWRNLEKYLDNNGYKDGWKNRILPSMKSIIIDVLLCSQEEIEERKNSFELYGADFMVTEDDLKTWLLEINSSPCMAASTDVTAKLTKSVLEDVMKVVLDYSENHRCDTGQFELLFKQSPFARPLIESSDRLAISGIAIKKPAHQLQPIKREMVVSKKYISHDDTSILRSKLKHIVECSEFRTNIVKHRKPSEMNTEHKSSERNFPQLSLDLRSRRLKDYVEQGFPADYRPIRPHTQSVTNPHRSSSGRLDYSKIQLVSPIVSNSTQTLETNKIFMVGSKAYARCLEPLKKYIGDTSNSGNHNNNHNYLRSGDRYLVKSKSSNDENSLLTKVQGWKQMDKSQNQRLHQILQAYLPLMD